MTHSLGREPPNTSGLAKTIVVLLLACLFLFVLLAPLVILILIVLIDLILIAQLTTSDTLARSSDGYAL
ncbi:hypothetical protein C1H46_005808 [Malus baccata]|uniref:Uncharacterized protein n=1 Tax=Malus baccata TaxID=106549 RepID=A0A540NBT3_MALBA|nr:hypothetical protein C1H46_005808 [Malus baccata]